MNIVFFTNTFIPHVGGVARSVTAFAEKYRELGHRVLIVAPEFHNMPAGETSVVRVPAIQNFNASDFSVAIPIPSGLTDILEDFGTDLIHSHHPFLLGMTAVRFARFLGVPLVFTHHTLYEQYTHYVPGNSKPLQRFVIELATHYANMCDQVFAPSESIRELIQKRGVKVPVDVIPTGVNVDKFAHGDGNKVRKLHAIPDNAFVMGHMGRLAPEKNLRFLCDAVTRMMEANPNVYFLLVGSGPSMEDVKDLFETRGLKDRLVMTGTLQHQDLTDALCAMDVFTFASKSETQGMVLTEAMAAGVPVVALNASGVREVVRHQHNGLLLKDESVPEFAEALTWMSRLETSERRQYSQAARETAREHSMENAAAAALEIYHTLAPEHNQPWLDKEKRWEQIAARIKAEWDIIVTVTKSSDEALGAFWDK